VVEGSDRRRSVRAPIILTPIQLLRPGGIRDHPVDNTPSGLSAYANIAFQSDKGGFESGAVQLCPEDLTTSHALHRSGSRAAGHGLGRRSYLWRTPASAATVVRLGVRASLTLRTAPRFRTVPIALLPQVNAGSVTCSPAGRRYAHTRFDVINVFDRQYQSARQPVWRWRAAIRNRAAAISSAFRNPYRAAGDDDKDCDGLNKNGVRRSHENACLVS